MRKYLIRFLIIVFICNIETGCRAKTCPAFGDDTPERGALFKKKKKVKQGLFSKKQRRY